MVGDVWIYGRSCFTMMALYFNLYSIPNESIHFWSVVFWVCLTICLRTILRKAI